MHIPLLSVEHSLHVVKELPSIMFCQHPGYYKAVFLKKTQTIIVSFYEYTVYNVLNYDAL
jgi:hypothetical protein